MVLISLSTSILSLSNSTVAFCASKFTEDFITPSCFLIASSTLEEQDAQVIPNTSIVIFLFIIYQLLILNEPPPGVVVCF